MGGNPGPGLAVLRPDYGGSPMLSHRRLRPARFVLILVLAVGLVPGLAACGGGGGGGGDAGTPSDGGGGDTPPVLSGDALTQSLLEACGGQTSIAQIQDLIATYAGVGAGSAPGVSFDLRPDQVEFAPGLVVPFELDLGGAEGPEGTGAFSFEDAAGDPVMPFQPQDVAPLFTTGIAAFPGVLALAPDGTQFILTIFGQATTPEVSGESRATLASGQPSLGSGNINVSEGGCNAQTTWNDVPFNSLTGQFPSAVFNTQVTQDTDTLVGTITTNGTRTATAAVQLNGGATTQWQIDLITGAVTPAP